MTTLQLANPVFQWISPNGVPLVGAKLYSYIAGSSTSLNTYTDSTGNTANPNPTELDTDGSASIWLLATSAYKFILKNPDDSVIWSADNIIGISAGLSGVTATPAEINLLDHNNNPSIFAVGNKIVIKASDGIQMFTDEPILDSNSNEVLGFQATTNAVNYVKVINGVTGGGASVTVDGSDINAPLTLFSKGTGDITIAPQGAGATIVGSAFATGAATRIYGSSVSIIPNSVATPVTVVADLSLNGSGTPAIRDSNSNVLVGMTRTASAVNYVNITNSATGVGPTIAAAGANSTADLFLAPKSTGNVRIGTAQLKFPNADGSSNQVLKTDGAGTLSFAPAGGGSYTLISTATAASSASISFTGLSSTYFSYVVIIDGLQPASASYLLCRTSTNNGSSYDSGASNYAWTLLSGYSNATSAFTGSAGDTGLHLTDSTNTISNTTGQEFNGVVQISNPSAALATAIQLNGVYQTSTFNAVVSGGGRRLATGGAVNAIQFLMSTGNMASGVFKLYGVSA